MYFPNNIHCIKENIKISGIIYDVIVEPPSIGSTTDEHGNSKPVRYTIFS